LSSRHVQLEPLPDGRVRVTNVSTNFPLKVAELPDDLACGEAVVLAPPIRIALGRRSVSVFASGEEQGPQTLSVKTRAPGHPETLGPGRPSFPRLEPTQLDPLSAWLQETVGVLQSAAGSDDFLARSAEALVAIVGLHAARVFLRRGDGWESAAESPGAAPSAGPSEHVLAEVLRQERTVWLHPQPDRK